MKLKKMLAGVMAFAMTATMLPGSMFAVPEMVEAATETSSLPEAKYELALDGNLDVTGSGAVGQSVRLATGGNYGIYEGEGVYDTGHDGTSQALSTGSGTYGFVLENAELDSTYTVSVWINLKAMPEIYSPVMFIGNSADSGNWVGMAGTGLWYGQESPWNPTIGSPEYSLNEWINYTLSVDGTTAVLYKNGDEIAGGTADRVAVTGTTKHIGFGTNAFWDPVPNAVYDDIKIYDEALTSVQAKALYNGGMAVELTSSVPSGDIRLGDTAEITANLIGEQEGDVVEWSSNSESVTVNDGVVTAVSEGTATITANLIRNDEIAASDTIDINVLPEKGSLIAEFTFDEDADAFYGAGAVATKDNDSDWVKVINDTEKGSVLEFTSQRGNSDANWLEVTKEDSTSLLTGVQEFTVSYDSNSEGVFMNNWTFFADRPGTSPDDRQYIALADYSTSLTAERYSESVGTGDVYSGWKHVDAVFSSNKTELYIDGVLRASMNNSHSVSDSLGNDSFIMIGRATFAEGTEYWNGLLDNYKIYDYALTAEEIASVPVSSVEVTADSSTLYEGETLQLAATAAPDNATDKTVEWTTSDPDVATVDENGLVTAKTAGDVTITATAQDKDGKSGSIDLTVKAALTYHEAKEPTCAETGNIEYWTDAEGNYYKDAAGMEPITAEETVIPATGIHDYSVTWSWSKVNDYTASVTFTCNVCGESESVDAEVSSTTVEGITTYTAKAVFNSEEYTATKEIVNNYMLTVEGGTITGGQKDSYSYADKVTVTAEESRDGKYFSGWYVGDTLVSQKQAYTFFVLDNMTVTAKYEGEDVVEEQPVVTFGISERQGVSGTEYNKVALTAQWSLPADYEFVGAGIIRSYSEYSDEEFRLDDVDGSDIRVQKTTLTNKNGTYKYNLTMSATTKLKTVYARGYVTYKDSEGIEYTVYTDIAQSAYTGI